jgi:hypothetical protein
MDKLKIGVATITLLAMLAMQPSYAYAQDAGKLLADEGDYALVKEGEASPYDGYLFDAAGLVKIMTNKSLEIQSLKINNDSENKKLLIELEMLKKQYNLELKLTKELNDNIMKLKDDRIKLLEDNNKWDDIKLFGSLLLGIALSVAIFFAAVQITTIKTP